MENKNSVVVSLLNVVSSIESEVAKCVAEGRKLFGTSIMKTSNVDGSVGYSFTSMELPEQLSENFLAWLLFVKVEATKESDEHYVCSINLVDKSVGSPYLTLECVVGKDSWDNLIKLTSLYTTDVNKMFGKGLKNK